MSRRIAAGFPFVERFDEVAAELPGAGLDWLDALRRDSLDAFNRAALPSTRVEAWKYTSLKDLAKTPFDIAPPPEGDLPFDLDGIGAGAPDAGRRLVFVNGRFDAGRSRTGPSSEGLAVLSLGEALRSRAPVVRPHVERLSALEDEALLALNTAFMMDGCVIVAEDGAAVDRPIETVFVNDARSPASVHPRNLVVAGAGSRVALTETHVGVGPSEYWSNPVTEIVVAASASVVHRKMQRESGRAYHLANTRVTVAERGAYRAFLMSVGARLSRCEIDATLKGEGADCRLDGVYLARDRQHADVTTRVTHAEPGGGSRQVFKGVLDGRSRGVFQGLVSVRPGAQRTDGHQLNKTLLLSNEAEIDTKPELEIYADDVKCSHGATAGHLDERELFYLRARGLGAEEARRLLIRAFVAEAVESVEDGSFRERLDAEIDDWLSRAAPAAVEAGEAGA